MFYETIMFDNTHSMVLQQVLFYLHKSITRLTFIIVLFLVTIKNSRRILNIVCKKCIKAAYITIIILLYQVDIIYPDRLFSCNKIS